jgi:hypothetical protein
MGEVLTYADAPASFAVLIEQLQRHFKDNFYWHYTQPKPYVCPGYSFMAGRYNYPALYEGITGGERSGTTRDQFLVSTKLHLPKDDCDHRTPYVEVEERGMLLTVLGGGLVTVESSTEVNEIGLHEEPYEGPPLGESGVLYHIRRRIQAETCFLVDDGSATTTRTDSKEVKALTSYSTLGTALDGLWSVVGSWQQKYDVPNEEMYRR